jgi:methylated-DNA-protein-cysteine methyltransferase-like protein
MPISKFAQAVVEIVKAVPAGKVVSYGQVAAYAGAFGAARAVGWILRQMDRADLPWWRVINNEGRISIRANWAHDAAEQKKRLEAEGVEVSAGYKISMEKYRFKASPDWIKTAQL